MKRINKMALIVVGIILALSISGTAVFAIDDTTPPTVTVQQQVNPGGKTLPFYQLFGTDDTTPAYQLQFFITDTGSGTVFGPFSTGVTFKYTVAPGAIPRIQEAGPPNLDYIIIGKGPGEATAVDNAGNESNPESL